LLLLSADLTAATDYLSSDCLTAIADALGFSPQLVTGGTIDGLEVKNGTLMGIPLSWPCLSLTHFSFIREVVKAPDGSYRLKGDDLIALWPQWMINKYFDLLEEYTGMVPNRLKSFIGPQRGIFCEKAYHRKGYLVSMDKMQVSLRALCCAWSPNGATSAIPEQLSAGVYLTEQIPRIGHARAHRLLTQIRPDLYGKMKAASKGKANRRISGPVLAVAYLPLALGGLSLIPRTPHYEFPRVICHFLTRYHNLDSKVVGLLANHTTSRFTPGTVQEIVPKRISDALGLARDPEAFRIEAAKLLYSHVAQSLIATGTRYDTVRVMAYIRSIGVLARALHTTHVSSTPLLWSWQSAQTLNKRVQVVLNGDLKRRTKPCHKMCVGNRRVQCLATQPARHFGLDDSEILQLISESEEMGNFDSHVASRDASSVVSPLASPVGPFTQLEWNKVPDDLIDSVRELKGVLDLISQDIDPQRSRAVKNEVDAVPRAALRRCRRKEWEHLVKHVALPHHMRRRALVDDVDHPKRVTFYGHPGVEIDLLEVPRIRS
jgi:hypothetical protein